MDDHTSSNFDTEFKICLQMLNPYLSRMTNPEILQRCERWILRLSGNPTAAGDDKMLRNKYVFTLCYQLATGALTHPFLQDPPAAALPPLADHMDESLRDLECVYIDFDENTSNTSIKELMRTDEENYASSSLYDHIKWQSHCDKNNNLKNDAMFPKLTSDYQDESQVAHMKQSSSHHTENWRNVTYSTGSSDVPREQFKLRDSSKNFDTYEHRVSNLIFKLRDIKTENMMLHKKIEDMQNEQSKELITEKLLTVDRSTSFNNICGNNDNVTGPEFLKEKLKEMQEYRSTLINTIASLQENIQYFEDMKQQEIDDLIASHKLEMIRVKSSVRTDIKEYYDKNIEDMTKSYENKIAAIQDEAKKDLNEAIKAKDHIINEKEKEIKNLRDEVEESKVKLRDANGGSNHSYKVQQLQKKLSRTEKSKTKHVQAYKVRLSLLQREKMMLEYAMQLQLVRQRAQLVNEAVDDRHAVVNRSLEKLENKYKDIIANMQAVAIQRRIQDQKILDGILQTAFRMFPTEIAPAVSSAPGTNNSRASPNPVRKQNVPSNFDIESELSCLLQSGKYANSINEPANKSYGHENVIAGYCLNSERLGELFKRVCIPQKDTGDGLQK